MSLNDDLLKPWRKLSQIVLLYAVAELLGAVMFTILTIVHAHAHDTWSNGDKVPDWVKSSCCGKADAHELNPMDVHHDAVNQFYYFDRGYKGKVNDKQVIPSEDGHYWIFYSCPGENCVVRCFFVPMAF